MKNTNSRKFADEDEESESHKSKSKVEVQLTKLPQNKIEDEVYEPKMVEKWSSKSKDPTMEVHYKPRESCGDSVNTKDTQLPIYHYY